MEAVESHDSGPVELYSFHANMGTKMGQGRMENMESISHLQSD